MDATPITTAATGLRRFAGAATEASSQLGSATEPAVAAALAGRVRDTAHHLAEGAVAAVDRWGESSMLAQVLRMDAERVPAVLDLGLATSYSRIPFRAPTRPHVGTASWELGSIARRAHDAADALEGTLELNRFATV